MEKQIQIMLDLQEQMNSKVDLNWREANDAWYRAIWVECAELMDHVGYKWWKKQETDVAQVHLEIVDIMHFMLAISLLNKEKASGIKYCFVKPAETYNINDAIDRLASEQLLHRNEQAQYEYLYAIMRYANMSFDKLFKQYCAKNVLNIFRQDNGYKEGIYKRRWNHYGKLRDDNEVLAKLLYAYAGTEDNFMGKLKDDLQFIYKQNL